MALTLVGVVLISPHAMFYDAGLLALAGLVAVERLDRRATGFVGAAWVLAWLQGTAQTLGFAPLFFVVLAAAVWLTTRLVRTEPELAAGAPVAAAGR